MMQRQESQNFNASLSKSGSFYMQQQPVVQVQQQPGAHIDIIQQAPAQTVFTRPALVGQSSVQLAQQPQHVDVILNNQPVKQVMVAQAQPAQVQHVFTQSPVKQVVQYAPVQQVVEIPQQQVQQQPQQVHVFDQATGQTVVHYVQAQAPSHGHVIVQQQQQQAQQPQEPPLPQGWQEVKDNGTGKMYYWNPTTNETTWTRPRPPSPQPVQQVIVQAQPQVQAAPATQHMLVSDANGQQYLISQQAAPAVQPVATTSASNCVLDANGNLVYITQQQPQTQTTTYINSNGQTVALVAASPQPARGLVSYPSFSTVGSFATASSGSYDVGDNSSVGLRQITRPVSIQSIPSNYGQFDNNSLNGMNNGTITYANAVPAQYAQQQQQQSQQPNMYAQQQQMQQQQQQPQAVAYGQQPQASMYGQQPQASMYGQQQQQKGGLYGQGAPQQQANPREQFQQGANTNSQNMSRNHSALHANEHNHNIKAVNRMTYETYEPRYE